MEDVQSLVHTILKRTDENVNLPPVSPSKMSRFSSSLFKFSGMKAPERKQQLFKIVRQEREDDDNRKKKAWRWLPGPLTVLRNRCNSGVKNAPRSIGDLGEKST